MEGLELHLASGLHLVPEVMTEITEDTDHRHTWGPQVQGPAGGRRFIPVQQRCSAALAMGSGR